MIAYLSAISDVFKTITVQIGKAIFSLWKFYAFYAVNK